MYTIYYRETVPRQGFCYFVTMNTVRLPSGIATNNRDNKIPSRARRNSALAALHHLSNSNKQRSVDGPTNHKSN